MSSLSQTDTPLELVPPVVHEWLTENQTMLQWVRCRPRLAIALVGCLASRWFSQSPALVFFILSMIYPHVQSYKRYVFDANDKVLAINSLTANVICERRWKYLYVTCQWSRRSFLSYHRLLGFSSLQTGGTGLMICLSGRGRGTVTVGVRLQSSRCYLPFSTSLHQLIEIYTKKTSDSSYKVEINWNWTGKNASSSSSFCSFLFLVHMHMISGRSVAKEESELICYVTDFTAQRHTHWEVFLQEKKKKDLSEKTASLELEAWGTGKDRDSGGERW